MLSSSKPDPTNGNQVARAIQQPFPWYQERPPHPEDAQLGPQALPSWWAMLGSLQSSSSSSSPCPALSAAFQCFAITCLAAAAGGGSGEVSPAPPRFPDGLGVYKGLQHRHLLLKELLSPLAQVRCEALLPGWVIGLLFFFFFFLL